MKFRLKITFCMLCLMAVLFGIGSSALIAISFQDGLDREKEAAKNSYRMLIYTLQMTGELETWSSTEEIQALFRQLSDQGGSCRRSVCIRRTAGCTAAGMPQSIFKIPEEQWIRSIVRSVILRMAPGSGISSFPALFLPGTERCIWIWHTIFLCSIVPESSSRRRTGGFSLE